MNDKIIKSTALYSILDYEPFAILLALVVFAYLFYKAFLREASPERHKNLQIHFHNLLRHSVWFSILFIAFKFIYQTDNLQWGLDRSLVYFGLAAFFWGMVVFVKASRLIILQYLFLGSMKSGVPVLLVNIFSLMLSLALGLWAASTLFGIQLGPLLATSAAFSIILGLALQDTLGNLFAGISLQLDRSFEIGDWLEVVSGVQRIVGQVKEITWRATILVGWSDEIITLPNRTMANSQISNYQGGDQPICRSQLFRLPIDVDQDKVRAVLRASVADVTSVRQDIPPLIYISETTESWLGFKIAYYIDSFGAQYRAGDEIIVSALKHLRQNGLPTAHQIFELHSADARPL